MTNDIDPINEWVGALVEVLRHYGRPMKQDEVMRLTARICGVSVSRMPFVVQNAVADGLVQRGGLGKYDVLRLVE